MNKHIHKKIQYMVLIYDLIPVAVSLNCFWCYDMDEQSHAEGKHVDVINYPCLIK